MTSLFLVPMDEPSYQATVASPVDLGGWTRRPADFPERARVWAVRIDDDHPAGPWPRNRGNWERMEPGDPLVVYRNRDSRYTATGRVGAMQETPYVRDEFWAGGPGTGVYAIEDFDTSLDLAPERLARWLGYDESYYPRGLRRVGDDRPVESVVDRLDI